MAVVIDTPGGNQGDDLGVTGVTAQKSRQKPYAWTCYGCGTQNVGFMENGCSSCPVGHGMTAPGPLPPVDFNCKACSGKGKVERKCGTCNGTGTVGAGDIANVPQACLTCGGAGSLGMDCARCEGSGLDPEPAAKPKVVKETPEMPRHEEDRQIEMRDPTLPPPNRLPSPLPSPLPTLEETPYTDLPAKRYFVVELTGTKAMVSAVAIMHELVNDNLSTVDGVTLRRRAVEIAPSPTTDKLFPKL